MAEKPQRGEERNPMPSKRHALGHTILVLAVQLAAITVALLTWVNRDLTYSPGWEHPMIYYLGFAMIIIAILGAAGFFLRRGTPRIG